MTDPYPTPHLLKSMKSRDVSWGEILEVLENPEVSFGPDDRGRYTHQRGNLCVVMAGERAVITVLLRQEESWTDTEARSRKKKVNTEDFCGNMSRLGRHRPHAFLDPLTGETVHCMGEYFTS